MTKQLAPIEELAEAQKHEDMLLELYKFHAYIPNDAMGNPLTPFGNFCEGWQAATEQSQKEIAELQAREKVLVDLAKLTYGYLWHINAGLDAPAILNVTSITPEKCSHIVRKLWLDVLTKEQRGEGINKALEALATVRGE